MLTNNHMQVLIATIILSPGSLQQKKEKTMNTFTQTCDWRIRPAGPKGELPKDPPQKQTLVQSSWESSQITAQYPLIHQFLNSVVEQKVANASQGESK